MKKSRLGRFVPIQELGIVPEDECVSVSQNIAKPLVIRRFLEDISREKNIPIERLITGVMQGDLYVWDYDSGRHYQEQFRVVSINGV